MTGIYTVHSCVTVPDRRCSAISAATRVFDALWRCTASGTLRWIAGRQLFRRRLHLVVEVNVILLVERLGAVEAGAEIGPGVHDFVGLEGLGLPLAVAHVGGVFRAPSRAFFHHRVADEVALDEAAVGGLFRLAP